MCGIVGFSWNDRSLLQKALSQIPHRGPDQEGRFFDSTISLGHKRLSIIDLSEKGRQPLFNEDNDICIIFNGEIFNFIELRKSLEQKGHRFSSDTDTEVIVHAYEEYGEECVNHFNGFFAFAIYNQTERRLFLARDRLGIKPLYYTFIGKGIFFASEIKALLAHDSIQRRVEPKALAQYLSLGYSTGHLTLFRGIYRLLPGHILTYDLKEKSYATRRYWSIPVRQQKKAKQYYKHQLSELLQDSVRRRLISDRPVGIFLSGGLDSSTILSLVAAQQNSSDIQTYSVGFGHQEDELTYAESVSRHFQTQHKSFYMDKSIVKVLPEIIWHSDEPISDPAFVPINILCKNAKKTATVILTGDGADEIFAGYEQYKFLTSFYRFRHIPRGARRLLAAGMRAVPYPILNSVFKYSSALGKEGKKRASAVFSDISNKSKAYLDFVGIFTDDEQKSALENPLQDATTEEIKPYFSANTSFLNQLMTLETSTLLPDQFLMKNDKMGMAHSMEIRTPYLDYRIVELAFTMPDSLKLRGFQEKYILREVAKTRIPKNILERKKQRFYVPMDIWIRDDLKNAFHEIGTHGSGYFRQPFIEKTFKRYQESPLFYGRQLWSLLTFELWHKMYIEKGKAEELL